MSKNLFITGNPGCGKTTLIKEICSLYPKKIGGFYTEEVMENNQRVGFILKTFDGHSRIFAHKNKKFAHKFKKYGVDIECLEEIGLAAIESCIDSGKIIAIDEIGSMEILSDIFCRRVYECLMSSHKVIATIRLKSQPFTDEIKKLPDSKTLLLTRTNYSVIKDKIIKWI